ncbi:DNA polymerase IV [Humidisolicoccus flavus]|uniref:DNA polymerase IV n=1 Tax=Humidisolicoccus flavus TaxID=3111414 RepID=UPI00324FE9F4
MSKQDGSNRLVSGPDVDDSTASILHIDLDAFFASASLLTRPELHGRPVVIGHDSSRSVVTAATYEARKFGVNSAMPMARAKQLCPHAIIVEPDFALYQRLSAQVMSIIDDFTPDVERLGIDEAFLDIASVRRIFGGANTLGPKLRARIEAETGLRASIGASSTKFIAKLASGRAKPNGLLVVPAETVLEFLHPQAITALWGVGGKTEEKLRSYGLHTVGDLANTPLSTLTSWLGPVGGPKLHALAWGRDFREVAPRAAEKSYGHDHTFGRDITDHASLVSEIMRLAGGVGRRLRAHGVTARTITLRVRFQDFRTITRSRTLSDSTSVTRTIAEAAVGLLEQLGEIPPVRLLGVQASNVQERSDALLLWGGDEEWESTERIMDQVHERFGSGAVKPASQLRLERKRPDLGD